MITKNTNDLDALPPTSGSQVSRIEAEVCQDIARRQRLGIQKYGMTVATNPAHLKEWLQHAYEESLDKAIYLKRAIAEIESANDQAQRRRE